MNRDPLTSREQAEHEDMERQDDWAEAQHKALLESYVKAMWDATRIYTTSRGTPKVRTAAHRLEIVARKMHHVSSYGVRNPIDVYLEDWHLDLLLTEWGAGKLIAYFGALAETEGQ